MSAILSVEGYLIAVSHDRHTIITPADRKECVNISLYGCHCIVTV